MNAQPPLFAALGNKPGKFGVGIEDMLYVIEDGCIDLTDASKQLIVL